MFFLDFNRLQPPGHTFVDSRGIVEKLTPYAKADASGAIEIGPVRIVQCVHWNTAWSRLEPVPLHHPDTGISLASWARIDNRDELAEELGLSRLEVGRSSDSELIFRAYLQWDEDCVLHLVGDFVFALHDGRKQKVFCGRDHLGVRPFYYHLSRDRFVCATTLSCLIDLEGVPGEIDDQWMVDYLTHLSMSFERTPYRGIMKLPPAHSLSVTARTQRLRQYFHLSAEPALELKDPREVVEAYREKLETAIACRVQTEYPLGSELSGGIDSSTITAYAAGHFSRDPSRFHAFGFAHLELEPQYILSVTQALGLWHTHIFTAREHASEDMSRRSLKILGYPVEHANATFHEPFYRLAEELGVRTLLSGFGGDEFATTIHGYLVPLQLMLQHRYKELYHQILPGNELIRFLRLIKLGLRQVKTGNFSRPEYNPRFYEAYRQRWTHQIVREQWVERFHLKERYFDEAKFDAGYTDLKKFTLEKRWMPFVPTRMENCTLMASARKIEYRWPLLDVRLVRLFLSLPSEVHYHRGMGRYLHRRAITGVVPDLVAWKPGKDMGNMVTGDRGGAASPHFAVDELHPRLLELVDVEKLREQRAAAARAESTRLDIRSLQWRLNLRASLELDVWLKQLFPVATPD